MVEKDGAEEGAILIYTTFADEADAKRVGQALVGAGLAACVNIFPKMTAIFEWEGKLDEAEEVAMLIKTRVGLQDKVLAEAQSLHPYETPALLVIDVGGGSEAFLAWISAQTRGG